MESKLLSALGLSAKEIKLYQAIFKAKEINPTALAKAVGIKRTTAYSMARSLVEKGLVIEDGTRRPRVFTIARSEEIQNTIDSEKKRTEERQALLSQLSAEVSKQEAEETYPVPHIRFVEEHKIEQFLNQRIVEWNTSMETTDPVFWGYQDPSFLEHYESWIKKYWDYAPKHFEVKLLTNHETSEKKITGKYERRHTKFWGEATHFISTTWIIGDYVVIINTKKHPFYLIEIHDKLMSHDQREVFRGLWGMV